MEEVWRIKLRYTYVYGSHTNRVRNLIIPSTVTILDMGLRVPLYGFIPWNDIQFIKVFYNDGVNWGKLKRYYSRKHIEKIISKIPKERFWGAY